jgi:hypothetical protein
VLLITFPILFLRGAFLGASGNAYLTIATFLFSVSLIAAILAVIFLNYVAAYITFLAVLGTELAMSQSPEIFSIHIAIALIFAEGISSLNQYHRVAQNLRIGGRETVSTSLGVSIGRFHRAFLPVAGCLLAISFGYSILPQILPIVSDLTALSLYATIGLVGIAITTLYLGQRAERGTRRSS